jgi:LPXTG-motif cell wall-anchored protein
MGGAPAGGVTLPALGAVAGAMAGILAVFARRRRE